MELTLRDGGRLYYEVHGERGDWLVLLNGAMATTASWSELVPMLTRAHRVVLLDFRDQGQSSFLSPGYNASLHAADVVELLDHLRIEAAAILGISFGGHVAMQLATTRGDRVRRLILSSIVPRPNALLLAAGDAWDAAAATHDGTLLFSACAPLVYSPAYFARHGDRLRERNAALRELPPAWFEAYRRLADSARSFDFTAALPDIQAPTLLVCGELDQLTPAREMFAMAASIPRCDALAVPDAGHAVFLEAPRAFAAAVLGFLALSERTCWPGPTPGAGADASGAD